MKVTILCDMAARKFVVIHQSSKTTISVVEFVLRRLVTRRKTQVVTDS